MPSREASLKVTLQQASFQSGLRKMGSSTVALGKRMGQAIKGPMVSGLKSARSEISGMVNGLKSGIKIAASLGGALSFAGLAKDALQMQNTYRNIAFNVNKVAGNAESWESVQALINNTVQKTGKGADELATSFQSVFEATGDLEFAKKAIQNVGETSIATGHSTEALANVMQLSYRKFGVGIQDADEAMVRFIEKTGVGGKGIEEMSNRFALMAGEAAGAGMKGKEGISQMLGMLLLLDSSIGEKADPGLKMMFQTVKGGSAQFVRMKKELGSGVKFTADMTAMEKIKALLGTKKGRAVAEQVFTADARVVYDELAKPFDKAMEEALAAGLSKQEAMEAGFKAFDANLEASAKSTMKYSQIQKEAADRQEKDPMVKMNQALARISDAFTKPEMIAAMNKLADQIPAFADAVVWALNVFLDNPWGTIATIVGSKIALAFAGTAVTSAIASGVKGMFAAKAVGAAAGAVPGLAAAGGGAALGGGALAATGMTVAGTAAAGAAAGAAGFLATQATLEATGGDKVIGAITADISELLGTGGIAGRAKGAGIGADVDTRSRTEIALQERANKAMSFLAKHAEQASNAMAAIGRTAADTSRGPLTPADPTPGSAPVG